jgi:hypothetical protein
MYGYVVCLRCNFLLYSGEALGAIGSADVLELLKEYASDPVPEVATSITFAFFMVSSQLAKYLVFHRCWPIACLFTVEREEYTTLGISH